MTSAETHEQRRYVSKLQEVRSQHGYTPRVLAAMLGVPEDTYNKWELLVASPPLKMAFRLAKALGLLVEELFPEWNDVDKWDPDQEAVMGVIQGEGHSRRSRLGVRSRGAGEAPDGPQR
jgi:DNA-binding XRE family transcriptional regulator